jgi:uncharacterized protein YoxC
MDLDERIARLTERHEALTGHVEILTADVTQLTADVSKLTADVTKMRSTMDDLLVGFKTVVELVKSHEHCIERLEGYQG